MRTHVCLIGTIALLTLSPGAYAADPLAWKDAQAVLQEAGEWDLLALDPFTRKEKTDTKDTFRRWKILGKTAVKDADARKALLAALDKGIADHAEKSRKEVEMGLLVESGCFQPRHGIRATSGGKTVEVLICFECSPVKFFLGE